MIDLHTTGGSRRRKRDGGANTAVVLCGALAREVSAIVDRRGWCVDLFGIPAEHHLSPQRITEALEARLSELSRRYSKVVVVYGDCGTRGMLDRTLSRHQAVRLAGAHCYEILGGAELERLLSEEPATYILTDFLVRHWEETVLRGMGLDDRPELKGICFGGFRRLVFLRQEVRPNLEEKARRIAEYLQLPLEVRTTGLAGLEERLARLIEE